MVVSFVYVFLGGSVGTVCRYMLGIWIDQKTAASLPIGTLVVNLAGCLTIGVLSGLGKALAPPEVLLADVGFVGAFTTFSTMSYETLRLFEQGSILEALLNPLLSLGMGLVFVGIGVSLGASWA